MSYYLCTIILVTISLVVGNDHIQSDVSKVKTLSTNTVRWCTNSLDCSDNQYCVIGKCQQGVELIKPSNWLNSFQLANFNKLAGQYWDSWVDQSFPSTILSNMTVKITGDTFGCCNNRNYLYNISNFPLQHLTSFELSFDLSIDSDGGDYFGIFFGLDSGDIDAAKLSNDKYNTFNCYLISFQMYDADWRRRGIHIYDTYSNKIATSPLPSLLSTFTSLKLKYAQGTKNTWMIYYNNILVLSFDDPNNPRWVESSKSRTTWGFVSQTGGAIFSGFIRSVILTVPPPSPVSICPDGYVFNERFSKCYKRYASQESWFDGENVCLQDGGQLVSVFSQEENNFLVSNLIGHLESEYGETWIGATVILLFHSSTLILI